MKAIWKICVAAVLAVSPMFALSPQAKENVVAVPNGDAEMDAAIAKAQNLLPQFWAKYAKPAGFGLKVAIRDAGNTEHFWLADLRRDATGLSGVIANEPVYVKSVKYGQRYVIPEGDISDWMYVKDGKIVGGYTLRAMLKHMPAVEAAELKSRLAPE